MTQPALPPSLPLSTLTQTRRFLLDPFDFIEEATERCGDIFSARLLGFGNWVFVGSPPLVREFFKAPDAPVVESLDQNQDQAVDHDADIEHQERRDDHHHTIVRCANANADFEEAETATTTTTRYSPQDQSQLCCVGQKQSSQNCCCW